MSPSQDAVQPTETEDKAQEQAPPPPKPDKLDMRGFIPGYVRCGGTKELGEVTSHNIRLLKRLNQVIFPVSYNDKFYKDVLEAGELAKLAYYNDIVRRLYIMTLGCLGAYRRLGIGTIMLDHVLKYVQRDGNFDSIFLHVQVNNDVAIEFYKKFGFEVIETKKHYYKRIEPADAHVLQKTLRPKIPSTQQNGVVERSRS
ncbi:NAA50 [Cordylochernes scorpioides]|uniref:N-terminal methionine N(alpha)-acetyltransferase NatE n=1 Tax=Cordylochernes scorpioides TaxID=51811 RepID=A0ABY6LU94_9ARAC|nr:NAA50 [Cordylochernes scorpioides]